MKHLPEKDNQFYPTPKSLSDKLFSMLSSKKTKYRNILEPSAGKGDLIKSFLSDLDYYDKRTIVFNCCETDKNLCSILSALNNDSRYDSNIKIVGSDFLEFDTIEKYDLIIMNPPFNDGEKHLLHAINYVNGELLCILNAETLKNPHSNYRKLLVQKLKELDATIIYESDLFLSEDAERKTNVDVALIHIEKKQNFEDVFGSDYEKEEFNININDGAEVKNIDGKENIYDLLNEYQDLKERVIKTCTSMFKSSYGCRELFNVGIVAGSTVKNFSISEYEKAIRAANEIIKKDFWSKLLDRDEFKRKLTSKEKSNFYNIIKQFSEMEFSYNNINTLYEYILDNGSNLFDNAILDLFDEITHESCWYPETKKNIYLFNGWKSNNGYKINKRFILIKGLYMASYMSSCNAKDKLDDIEKVFVYFNNGIYPEVKLSDEYIEWNNNYKKGLINNTFFENSMFKVRVFKKGTSHFYVKDESLLRRFNVYVSKQRQWLPPDYAMKTYQNCSAEEKRVIDEFEGEKSYQFNLNDPLLANLDKSMLMIEAA